MKPSLLSHPIFLTALGTLLLNDWVCKPLFHNFLTGKLSDFAGLFAFAFFWSALFSKRHQLIHLLSAVLFCWWKSPLAQSFIDTLNHWHVPIQRAVDYSDYWALLSLSLSYVTLQKAQWIPRPILVNAALMLLSLFSFIATSLPPPQRVDVVAVNKTYEFDFSRAELITRLNDLQLGKLWGISKGYMLIESCPDNNIYYNNPWGGRDTVGVILDDSQVKTLDTIYYRSSLAQLLIIGDDSTSSIKLIHYRRYLKWHTKDQQEKSLAYFEKKILKEIKKYPRY